MLKTERHEIIINKNYSGFNPSQFGYQQCQSGWYFGPAVRSCWLLHYVVSGKGIFEREGKTHNIVAGEIFVIPPFTETYYRADESDPWHYIWIGFEADKGACDVFNLPVISRAGVGKIFEDACRCCDMKDGKSAFLSAKIWELAALLMEEKPSSAGHIDKALNIIHSEYASVTVASIAKRLHLDRCYFSGLFKENIGQSPIEYLTGYRLEKAAQLISEYDYTPTIAAYSVGYADYCNFSKSFKKHYGCSPREYIKKSVHR